MRCAGSVDLLVSLCEAETADGALKNPERSLRSPNLINLCCLSKQPLVSVSEVVGLKAEGK